MLVFEARHHGWPKSLLALCLSLTASFSVNAAEIQAFASVQIVPALSISETRAIDFGNLASSSGRCSMGADGRLTAESAICEGQGQLGHLTLSGQSGAFVNVQLSSGSTAQLIFTPQLRQSSSRIQLGDSPSQLSIGGTLDLDAPENGKHAIQFGVTANYE